MKYGNHHNTYKDEQIEDKNGGFCSMFIIFLNFDVSLKKEILLFPNWNVLNSIPLALILYYPLYCFLT